MNKTLVSISAAVIACTIGVTTQLAGVAEAQDMAVPDIRPPLTEEQKLIKKMDYIEVVHDLYGDRTPQENASIALGFLDRGIYANSPEFKKAYVEAEEKIKNSRSEEEAFAIVNKVAKIAGGNQSRIVTRNMPPTDDGQGEVPQVTTTDGIATIKLPRMSDRRWYPEYTAPALQGLQTSMPNSCGAIVDLREANGKNLMDLLTSVSPLLPDGTALERKDNKGNPFGIVVNGTNVKKADTPNKIPETKGKFNNKPVAILTGENTGGAGEATLLSFRGLDNAKTFGQPTAGLAGFNSVNSIPRLSVITTTEKYVARTGEEFNDKPITPNVTTNNPEKDAAAWLKQQCHNGNAAKR